jgi:hypothetical protein
VVRYIFSFEILRHYPHNRSYILKAPLKRSMKDSIFELISGGSKKR